MPATVPRARRSRRGAILLEVAFALFVLIVCLGPAVVTMIAARKMNRQAQLQSVAYQVARSELETLKEQSFSNRLTTTGTSFLIPTRLTSNFSNDAAMTGTYSISTYSAFTTPPVQQITVRVTWKRLDNSSTTKYSTVELSQLCAQEPGK